MFASPLASLCASLLSGLPVSMNQTERYYRIHQLIGDRGLITFAALKD